MAFPNNVVFCSVDGNIACGKSTALKCIRGVASELRKEDPTFKLLFKTDVDVFQEPVSRFSNFEGMFDPLYLMYTEPVANCAVGQLHIMRVLARSFKTLLKPLGLDWTEGDSTTECVRRRKNPRTAQSQEDEGELKILVTERSPVAIKAFLDTNLRCGSLSRFAVAYLETLWDEFFRDSPKPSLFIFLDTSNVGCIERVKLRSRPGEEKLTLPYLDELSYCYSKVLSNVEEDNDSKVKKLDIELRSGRKCSLLEPEVIARKLLVEIKKHVLEKKGVSEEEYLRAQSLRKRE